MAPDGEKQSAEAILSDSFCLGLIQMASFRVYPP